MFYLKSCLIQIILLGLWCGIIHAQAQLTIDLQAKAIKESEINLSEKNISIKLINCGNYKEAKLKIASIPNEIDLVICNAINLPNQSFLPSNDYLFYQIKVKHKDSVEFEEILEFKVNKEGKVESQNYPEEIPKVYLPSFVPSKALLTPYNSTKADEKAKCTILYDPCENQYKIFDSGGNTLAFLNYEDCGPNSDNEGKGIIFKIKDFNVLKYEIAINSQFSDPFTNSQPDISSILALIGGSSSTKVLLSVNETETATAGGKSSFISIEDVISIIYKLRTELKIYLDKTLLSFDCVDAKEHGEYKKTILDSILKYFPSETGTVSTMPLYSSRKANYMKINGITEKEFNKKIMEGKGLKITPDSLVKETEALIFKLMNTTFLYQYNVPQLQSRDQLEFKLDIKPRDGSNGGIYMKEESLLIPIRGGIKLDYSAGLYYSNILNGPYQTRDIFFDDMTKDSVINKRIVEESQNGGTVGLAVLTHIYPRGGYISSGLTFGFGVSPDLNYSILTGGSIVLGRKNRVMLSGGLNVSNVKRLSTVNEVNDTIGAMGSIKTVNRFRTGGFLSLTYTFGLKNTVQATSSSSQASSGDSGKKEEGANKS